MKYAGTSALVITMLAGLVAIYCPGIDWPIFKSALFVTSYVLFLLVLCIGGVIWEECHAAKSRHYHN